MASSLSAHEACEKILLETRSSNLHFVISESPYSAQISLRKRFVKEFNASRSQPQISLNSDKDQTSNIIQQLEEENRALKN